LRAREVDYQRSPRRLADIADAAVETVHHVRKTNGTELTAEDARGAISLIGAARSVRVLNPMTADEASKAGINPAERRLYFRVDNGKANMAPPAAAATWRHMIGVPLGNGTEDYPEDNVGVVTPWAWPGAFAGLTSDDLKQVQNRISSGKWRADVRADDWVGHAVADVLGLDLDQKVDRARVKSLLKTWAMGRWLRSTAWTTPTASLGPSSRSASGSKHEPRHLRHSHF
jgi:hypothetical protein